MMNTLKHQHTGAASGALPRTGPEMNEMDEKLVDDAHQPLRRPRGRRLPLRGASARALVFAVAGLLLTVSGFALRGGWGSGAEAAPPQVREFTLTAEEIDWEIMPGTVVRAWAYNGQMPGPEIRVREGDTVRVTVKNRLPVGTTVHWHGIDNTPAMDGPAGLNQAPIEPGQDFTYEWVADPAGSRMYHSHTDVATQTALGLYGPLVVEPKEQGRTYDREYTYMLGEWDMEMTPAVATGNAPRGPRDSQLRGGELGADLFLMNGHAGVGIPALEMAEGERVLIRLMNMGNIPHPIHTHGHSFKIVATDGNPVPEGLELTKDTVLVAPGERYDIELEGDNPGVWMFHCHIEAHAENGMMTSIHYEGTTPTGPAADMGAAHVASHGAPEVNDNPLQVTPADPAASAPPSAAPSVAPSAAPSTGSSAEPVAAASTAPTETIDDPSLADAGTTTIEVDMRDNRFEEKNLTIPAGTTVTWVNVGRNMHSVASYDGLFGSSQIPAGESYAFTFDTPGTYKYICKHHALAGMGGTITVT